MNNMHGSHFNGWVGNYRTLALKRRKKRRMAKRSRAINARGK